MTTKALAAIDTLLAEFRERRPAALARAVSIVENHRPGSDELLSALHGKLGHARRIGITGPPGAGKSTLVVRLAALWRAQGHTVGIIAVDPTSPFTGGALLGDRIRMEEVALDPGIFIRSMATRGALGGLAATSRETADVLDAYGFDRIILETVGVGQSELDIARTADSSVVVLVPESGDSIQTMKAGLMEIADLFVVNKADRPGADRLRNEVELMLGLRLGADLQEHAGAPRGGAQAEESGVRGAESGERERRGPLDAAGARHHRRERRWRGGIVGGARPPFRVSSEERRVARAAPAASARTGGGRGRTSAACPPLG